MRIGLLVNRPVPEAGGAFSYQQDLFRSFLEVVAESKHEFHVIGEPGYAKDLKHLLVGKANVISAPMASPLMPRPARSSYRYLTQVLRCSSSLLSREARVAAARKLDLLWPLGLYALDALDVPFIATVLDLQHRIQPWFPEVSRGRLWQSRENYYQDYLRRATFVITGTEEGRREIERYYGLAPDRIRVLPLATPRFALEGERADSRTRLAALGLEPGFLFYPAQFWSHKNHVNLLHALRLLHDKHGLLYQLVLVGSDQGNQKYIHRVATDLRLDKYVRFLGYVSQEDLVAIYLGAEALIFVTFFGPDNLPPLEAFALGCPVVASNVRGASEQLGDAALLVRPESPDEIANAVARLRQDKSMRKLLLERGRQRACSWTGSDYIRGVFRMLDEFESIRRCWE
jgi:glycosyltransferase involved in cell wall biosynthesis